MAVRQLGALATLPGTLASILSSIDKGNSRSIIAEIINFDPAMTAAFLNHRSGRSNVVSISELIADMPAATIKSIALSVPVYQQFDESNGVELEIIPYSQMVLHSLAAGCAARMMADICLKEEFRQIAYTAGLLHDIGKLALYQVMPKSFERVAELSMLNSHASITEENENLGINHSTIGRILAEKWNMPDPVIKAVWLHHTQTQIILDSIENNKFISVVAAGDIIARKAGIGHSASFNTPVIDNELLDFLGLTNDQVDDICDRLTSIIGQRDDLLGINSFAAQIELPRILQDCAAEEAVKNSALAEKNRRLLAASMQADFIHQFITDMPLHPPSPVQLAQAIMQMWAEHFNVNIVAFYYYSDTSDKEVEIVTNIESSSVNVTFSRADESIEVIPGQICGRFDVINAAGTWIETKVSAFSGISKLYMIPLISQKKTIGAIVFEQQRIDISEEDLKEFYEVPAAVVATMLDRLVKCFEHIGVVDRFATLLSIPEKKIVDDTAKQTTAFDEVAEMASGAAHELNNPLAVISGRTQLLAEAETDPEKKRDLEQIRKRCEEASRIVTQLMNYAKPAAPKPAQVAAKDIVNAAAELVIVAKQIEDPQITYHDLDRIGRVYADADQMMAVFTAIIANAVESYDDANGTVRITADCPQKEGYAGILVTDQGRGMDAAAAAKATTPFFSSMPAGRKRGMGLANAQRLISLNNGMLKISSIPGKGTTVRVDLPAAD